MNRAQADIIPATVDWLAVRVTAEVRKSVPEDWTVYDGPLLVVADDGGPARWPVKSRHTIRLTAWAEARDAAREVVTLAAARLAGDRPRPAGVEHVSPDMGVVLDGRDANTGAFLASVLVTMVARMVTF